MFRLVQPASIQTFSFFFEFGISRMYERCDIVGQWCQFAGRERPHMTALQMGLPAGFLVGQGLLVGLSWVREVYAEEKSERSTSDLDAGGGEGQLRSTSS